MKRVTVSRIKWRAEGSLAGLYCLSSPIRKVLGYCRDVDLHPLTNAAYVALRWQSLSNYYCSWDDGRFNPAFQEHFS